MKKFISTIAILSIVIFTNSCRAQDEDLLTETPNKGQTNKILRRSTDSIPNIPKDSTRSLPIVADPPPKNGHQW